MVTKVQAVTIPEEGGRATGLKRFLVKFSFRPSKLRQACNEESRGSKARLLVMGSVMLIFAMSLQYVCDALVFRSQQLQNAALAGMPGFEFLDYSSNGQWKVETWQKKQTLQAWNDKDIKQLKQINMGWVTETYEQEGKTVYVGPNGNPYDNEGFYK